MGQTFNTNTVLHTLVSKLGDGRNDIFVRIEKAVQSRLHSYTRPGSVQSKKSAHTSAEFCKNRVLSSEEDTFNQQPKIISFDAQWWEVAFNKVSLIFFYFS